MRAHAHKGVASYPDISILRLGTRLRLLLASGNETACQLAKKKKMFTCTGIRDFILLKKHLSDHLGVMYLIVYGLAGPSEP